MEELLLKLNDQTTTAEWFSENYKLLAKSMTNLWKIAEHPNCPEKLRESFLKSGDWQLRYSLAANKTLSKEMNKLLRKDKHEKVREKAFG